MTAPRRRVRSLVVVIALLLISASASRAQQYRMYTIAMGQLYKGGVWAQPLTQNIATAEAQIDPESPALVGVLDRWFPGQMGNRANFTEQGGIYLYIASPNDPFVKVTLDADNAALQQVFNQVPFPSYAQPSPNADERMAILQPSSSCVWEFWHLHVASDGSWHAGWGGRDCNVWNGPGVYRNVDDLAGNVLEQNGWGAPASGFAEMAGPIMVDELAHGVIPHAIGFAADVSATCGPALFALPAQRTDGGASPVYDRNGDVTNCIPEGAQFRLPPPCPPGHSSTPGVCFNLSDLNGDPTIVTELAAAAQRYGLIDENSTSGGVVGVESGDAQGAPHLVLGADPYTSSIPAPRGAPYSNTPFFGSYTNQNALALFPWSSLELVKMSLASAADPTTYIGSDPLPPLWPN